jgi:hypothetical protein
MPARPPQLRNREVIGGQIEVPTREPQRMIGRTAGLLTTGETAR